MILVASLAACDKQPAQNTEAMAPTAPTAATATTAAPAAAHAPAQPKGRVARGPGSPDRLEETVRTHAAPPANDDRTSPYITLPSEVKPSGFAHTKRVAAKQR